MSSCLHRASMIIKHFVIQLMHNVQYVDKIKIIKYLKVLQHVSVTEDPSSGSLVQYLAKNYKNCSIVSVVFKRKLAVGFKLDIVRLQLLDLTHFVKP